MALRTHEGPKHTRKFLAGKAEHLKDTAADTHTDQACTQIRHAHRAGMHREQACTKIRHTHRSGTHTEQAFIYFPQ